jgi:hypothetical protein
MSNKNEDKSNGRRFFLKSSTVLVASALFPAFWTQESIAAAQSTGSLFKGEGYSSIGEKDVGQYALNIFRAGVLFGLGKVPVAGPLISAIAAILWPMSGPSLWDQIKDQVEKMIDQKIDQAVYQIVKNFLDGLGLNLKSYISSLRTGDPSIISQNFVACHQIFTNEGPQFTSEGRQEQLLPLFAIFALLHISLLRDAVLNAKAMGWNQQVTDYYTKVTIDKIKEYGDYIDGVYEKERVRTFNRADQLPEGYSTPYTHKFFVKNEFLRKMQFAVLDTRELFPYLDPIKYPTEYTVQIDRVVYSWPVGSAKCQGREVYFNPGRGRLIRRPTAINLYSGGGFLDPDDGYNGAVVGYTVHYDSGYGPWGNSINYFGRYNPGQGDSNYGVDNSESNRNGPIVAVWVNDDLWTVKGDTPWEGAYLDLFKHDPEYLYTLKFEFENGVKSETAGGCLWSRPPNSCIYFQDHILVDICDEGYHTNPEVVGCVIFGFQLKNMGHIFKPEEVMRLHYITSTEEPTILELEDVAKEYQRNAIPVAASSQPQALMALPDLPADMPTVETRLPDWQSERQAFLEQCDAIRLDLVL